MSGKEPDEFYKIERYRNVDEYDPVLRWHCRLDEPKPRPVQKRADDVEPQLNTDGQG